MSRKYVNRNGRPITLPNQRGGKHTFKPNEGTTNPWFSRFIGPGMLTEETSDGKAVHTQLPKGRARLGVRSNRKVRDSTIVVPPRPKHTPGRRGGKKQPTPQELLNSGCISACESTRQALSGTDHWVTFGGMFYCRFCDFFSGDGEKHMKDHLRTYHGVASVEAVVESHRDGGLFEEVVVDVSEKVDVPLKKEKAPDLSPEPDALDDSPPPKGAESSIPKDTTTKKRRGYTCDVCGKTLRTKRGLSMHKKRAKDH